MRLRILHAVHDFLPRHVAGSEIYAYDLARTLATRHDVWVLAAEYDPAANHGQIRWREHGGLPVAEIVNNWECRGFDETYASPRLNRQIEHVLHAVQPDVVHVHNLLNLSFDLPRLARERGARTVATLHDYTLVCAAGGQRIHRAGRHVCETIDPDRCARCFGESAFGPPYALGRLAAAARGRPLLRAAAAVHRAVPRLTASIGAAVPSPSITPDDIRRRLAYARHVFHQVDLFVAPSSALAREYVALGLPETRMLVSANGSAIAPAPRTPRAPASRLTIGYVGSLVWHKGVHVLLEAARGVRGEIDVVLFGDRAVSPAYTRDLDTLAAGARVRFAGAFDRRQLSEVYGAMDVLAVPSLWPENAPLVVQEAFLHGVPVVAARVGGLPELIQDGVNGLLYDASSVEALRAALQRLVDSPRLRACLAAAAPPVKTIERDALDWEQRYARVLAEGDGR
ncbi:MAG TPA: glycosyltransferase family 4 protein [Dehalococcoidia bacterium]|nr:glycosyltransferase family 4 protein [Dehalococcoidia bacterium]